MGDELLAQESIRVRGTTIVKPIIYGNISQHFGKKRESDGHTHDWTVYVKPYNNEDISVFIKKVHFKLHESYANPNRVVSKPPYEVSESGWGEFEIQIKIYFNDITEKPITLYHGLKLFHTNEAVTSSILLQGRKTVISEFYDEIIFQDPTANLLTLLNTTRPMTLGAYKHETDFKEKQEKTLGTIQMGRNQVQAEITDFKDRLQLAKETIAKFKAEIAKVQKDRGTDMSIIYSTP